MQKYSEETKNIIRRSAYDIIMALLRDEEEFMLVIWTTDNWDRKLPKSILERFPDQLVLSMKDAALETSYYDDESEKVIINTILEGEEYTLELEPEDIISVIDSSDSPLIICNFERSRNVDNNSNVSITDIIPTDKESIIDMIAAEGLPEDNVRKSLETFLENNYEIKNIIN